MNAKKKEGQSKELSDIQGIFTNWKKKQREERKVLDYEVVVDRITQRHKLVDEHFSSEKKLEEHINEHKNADLVKKRIKSTVASKRNIIRQLSKKEVYKKLEYSSDIQKYIALVKNHYVNPTKVLPEIPDKLRLCDIKRLIDRYQEIVDKLSNEQREEITRLILESVQVNFEDISNKWCTITGHKLNLADSHGLPDLSKIPPLGELEYYKAPVPIRPKWSNALFSIEARKMGHRPDIHDDNAGSNSLWGENTIESTDAETSTCSEDGENTSGSAHYLNKLCDINKFKLYDTDSFTPLGKPKAPETPWHTFPGPLRRAEDIFYDFSLIIPVDPEDTCDAYVQEGDLRTFNPLTARVLVGKATTILDFLDWLGLSKVLGNYVDPDDGEKMVKKDIEELLEDVVKLQPENYQPEQEQLYAKNVRELRSRLRAMSGLIRLAARTELYSAAGSDLVTGAESLLSLAAKFDATVTDYAVPFRADDPADKRIQRVIANINGKDYAGNSVSGGYPAGTLMWFPQIHVDPDRHPNSMNDDLKAGWWFPFRWDAQEVLGAYLHALGVIYQDSIEPFKTKAIEFANKIIAMGNLGDATFEAYKRLAASGIINSALSQLSELLLEIAAQLTLPRQVHAESSKRLGLQVIFRQYWHPIGYVQGKLVGYKNLIPNEKETLKRRTFIKSTRETSTIEEFATARQDDYSHSQKETAEVVKETGNQFNFTTNASGHYNMGVYGVEARVGVSDTLTHSSKATQNMLSESIMKGSAKYNEKREVKIRELSEVEDVQEVTKELHNSNAEITANYFYYQLLRQYRVTVDLHDLRPVLLRTRDVPGPAEIDDHFISTHMHILIRHLPEQLSADAQESTDSIGIMAKTMIRRRAEMDERAAELQVFKDHNPPPGENEPDKLNRWTEKLRVKEQALSEARGAFIEAEEEYSRLRIRMNRVINHVRENICYYIQFIWQDSPKVDQDKILQEEMFGVDKLPAVTRGLMRQGYFGNEEIFDFTGQCTELFQAFLDNLTPGSEILSELMIHIKEEKLQANKLGEQRLAHSYIKLDAEPFNDATVNGNPPVEGIDYTVNSRMGSITFTKPLDDTRPTVNYTTYQQFAQTALFQYLDRYYHGDFDEIINNIESLAFVTDPVNPEEVLSSRTIQVAQDALVVETMPGQVPLLEGFQMAHRMLDVQQSCLENVHLAEMMTDRPWWKRIWRGSYKVKRYEGSSVAKDEE